MWAGSGCFGDGDLNFEPGGGLPVEDTSATLDTGTGGTDTGASDTATGDDLGITDDVGSPDDANIQPEDTSTDMGSDSGGGGPCLSYESTIQPIFTKSCANAACHGGNSPKANLSLVAQNSHAELVGVQSSQVPAAVRVEPFDPEASYLITKLNPNPPVGQQMPFGPKLNEAQITLIWEWIEAGAPNGEYGDCSGGGPGPVVSVEIVAPGGTNLLEGNMAQLTAEAYDDKGNLKAGAVVEWSSAKPKVVYIDGDGGIVGISPGMAMITATVDGIASDPLTVEVTANTPPTSSFMEKVVPYFTAGCALAGCHVDDGEADDLRFDRPADKIFEKIVDEKADEGDWLLVDPSSPLQSFILVKVIDPKVEGGQMPLGMPRSAAEDVMHLLRWIKTGADWN